MQKELNKYVCDEWMIENFIIINDIYLFNPYSRLLLWALDNGGYLNQISE